MVKHVMLMLFASFCFFMTTEAFHKDKFLPKIYIDEDEFSNKGDSFHIHIGNNVWLCTNTVHRDETGMYTFENHLARSMTGPKDGYERKWKCPYCYSYWPIGKPCGNPDCPSKYRI